MQMKSAIAALSRSTRSRIEFPKTTEVAKACASMKTPETNVSLPTLPNLDQICDRIRRTLRSGQPLSFDDFRYAPSCLWNGARPLDSDDDVANAYLDAVRRSGKRTAFKKLAAAYVIRYPVASSCFRKASDILADMAQKFQGPWTNAHRSLSIFNPERAPRLTANAALYRRVPTVRVLVEHGLRIPAGVGFAEAAFVDGLQQIAGRSMPVEERLDIVKLWIADRPWRLDQDDNRGAIADALLVPYEGAMPEKRDRDRLLSFLLDKFNDPRARPENWRPMPRSSQIARKWLIEQSLRQFFDVVSHSIQGPANALQWRYRRAFWTAVYDRQLISDACVIFDEEAARVAHRVFEGKTPYASWRRSGRKQIQRGQSCLLLRIGSGVVAEWSHNGKCNIWLDASDPTAPTLHREAYSSDEVQTVYGHAERAPGKLAIPHSSPGSYSWQNKVADVVADMTAVRIFRSQYKLQ